MKVSIDGILGSAKKLNNRRQLDEENQNKREKDIKTDSVTISRKVNTRLHRIESEFREIQSSLTKSQITKDGIEQLKADLGKGGSNQKDILENVTFDGKKVLHGFMGGSINGQTLESRSTDIDKLIIQDIGSLKKLHVEVDNIMASNLPGLQDAGGIQSSMDKVFLAAEKGGLKDLSNLNMDSVMRLIK